MFRWFTRATRKPMSANCRRARPKLEWLETRDCPSVSVTSLSVAPVSGQIVQVKGTVQDDMSDSCTVNLAGVVNDNVKVAKDGTFELTTTASALGAITAVAKDDVQPDSNGLDTQLVCDPPVVQDFHAVHGLNNQWTLQGEVISETTANLQVTFTGPRPIQGATAQTDDSGGFASSFAVSRRPGFSVTAVATDCWGQQSDPVLWICY
jgi:hypothetical protein